MNAHVHAHTHTDILVHISWTWESQRPVLTNMATDLEYAHFQILKFPQSRSDSYGSSTKREYQLKSVSH